MTADAAADLVASHRKLGWRVMLVAAVLGLTLEGLHGFKVPLYVDVSNETRRLMWTLAHAHGILLGLVNVAFAASLDAAGVATARRASPWLRAATVVLPAGFFLGGCFVHGGDPGLPVLLVPFGAAALLGALAILAR